MNCTISARASKISSVSVFDFSFLMSGFKYSLKQQTRRKYLDMN